MLIHGEIGFSLIPYAAEARPPVGKTPVRLPPRPRIGPRWQRKQGRERKDVRDRAGPTRPGAPLALSDLIPWVYDFADSHVRLALFIA